MPGQFFYFSFILSLLIIASKCFGDTNTVSELQLKISKNPAGDLVIQWPQATNPTGYRLEYRNQFHTGSWIPCEPVAQWPSTNVSFVDTQGFSQPARFYRLVANLPLENNRGKIISTKLIKSYSSNDLAILVAFAGIPVKPQYGVEVHQIIYQTINAKGTSVQASGAFIIPQNVKRSLPLLSYQHGTVLEKAAVASQGAGDELLVGMLLGSVGFATSMPDYLGLGISPGLHPYVHAKSSAIAVVDMLRASRSFCATKNQALNTQLFLMGYSEGGYATMAAHREIEQLHAGEFTITGSAPMAGPHDISGTMTQIMIGDQAYNTPYYLPFTLFAYNDVYRLFNLPNEILLEPYATKLPPLFDGYHSGGEINSLMPSVPSKIFRPDFLEAFRQNPQHPFLLALKENDLYDWTPVSPMHMYHCQGDVTVPFINSQIALNRFHSRGATHVQLIDPYPSGNHGTGALYCMLAAWQWFESLKQ